MTTLRQRIPDDLQLRNYSPETITCSLRCVANFAQHFRTPPDRLDPEPMRPYQLYRVQEKHASWSLIIQTVCHLRFFSRIPLGKPCMVGDIPQPKRLMTFPTVW